MRSLSCQKAVLQQILYQCAPSADCLRKWFGSSARHAHASQKWDRTPIWHVLTAPVCLCERRADANSTTPLAAHRTKVQRVHRRQCVCRSHTSVGVYQTNERNAVCTPHELFVSRWKLLGISRVYATCVINTGCIVFFFISARALAHTSAQNEWKHWRGFLSAARERSATLASPWAKI